MTVVLHEANLQTPQNTTLEAVRDQLDRRQRSEVHHIVLCNSDHPIHVVLWKPVESLTV